MRLSVQRFQRALEARQGFKVISGIANFDLSNVMTLVKAVNNTCQDISGVALDVAAQAEIIKAVRSEFAGMLFASSVVVSELVEAVEAGADAVELGNFDALYAQGYYISADEVLALANETVEALAGKAFICITIPGHLSQEAQIKLAQDLEAIGVNLIQTEGAVRLASATPEVKTLNAEEKALVSIQNTQAIAQVVNIPVMAASGMDAHSVQSARLAGAAAVGIGSAVNKLASQNEMQAALVDTSNAWTTDVVSVSAAAV